MEPTNFRDLEGKGFVVVPSFLSGAEVDELQRDFSQRPNQADNRNYNLAGPSPEAYAHVQARVQEVMKLVCAQTDLRVHITVGAAYFAIGRGINFPWHQDHESFFALQNHYDYLNFYIPIVKPRRDKSNLSIIPFDVLERESPRSFRRLVRGGAGRFLTSKLGSLVLQDDSGRVHFVRENIDRLAHTPQLGPGDLLLLRGDMIHRTEDVETERVSLSVRACTADGIVRRSRLADGGLHKAQMMAKNPALYQRMFAAFDVAGKDELTVMELNTAMQNVEAQPPKGRRAFLTYLLGQKRRTGVLGHFVPRVITSAAADRSFRLYEWVAEFSRPYRVSAPTVSSAP